MPPFPTIAILQQAITLLLTTREPAFIAFGGRMFLSFATILIAWQGIQMMLKGGSLNDGMFEFAKLLLFISFGYSMIAFYESPIPGIGVSFTNLITDQTAAFANTLESGSVKAMGEHIDDLWTRFMEPNYLAILPNLLYWLLMILVLAAKAALIGINAFGLVASAVCALVGPIFVPFFIVPQLDFLFWGWFKAFLQYSFIPVIAAAYIMVFEHFIFAYITQMPPGIVNPDLFTVYVLQVLVVLLTLTVGVLAVPFITSSIFSGSAHHGGGGIFAAIARVATRR